MKPTTATAQTPTRKKLLPRIAAAQKHAETAKKAVKAAKLVLRKAKQELKEAKRAARKMRKAVKALELEIADAVEPRKPRRRPSARKRQAAPVEVPLARGAQDALPTGSGKKSALDSPTEALVG